MRRLWRDERGGILVLGAVMIPVFLLITAMVVDVGNWYTHKRQLQNKADSGALAAGVEYISRLKNCVTVPAMNGIAISDVAKRYAGINDPADAIAGPEYNQTINETTRLTVAINATSETAADFSDGGNPCEPHAGDAISPPDPAPPNPDQKRWTDVKVRENQIGTLFGGFGLDLDHVTAQARVELKPIVGIGRAGLPFVAETGDVVECVWAEFVRARDGNLTTGFSMTGGGAKHVLLTRVGSSNTWEANTLGLTFNNAHDDVAVRYWLGSTNGTTPCNFSDPKRVPLPENDLTLQNSEGTAGFRAAVADGDVVNGIDWINVYDNGPDPGVAAAPKLELFRLTPGSCGTPGFVVATGPCTIGFIAIVDDGGSPAPSRITVNPSDPQVGAVTVLTTAASTTGDLTTYSGTITLDPTAEYSPTSRSQSYTQTGQTYFRVAWQRNVGFVGATNCATGPPCSGTFAGESVSGHANVQQATYVADPVTSTPLAYAELIQSGITPITGSYPAMGATGPFTIRLSHNAVLNEAFISLLRESVQGTGNRTRAIYCGNGPGGGAAALEDAVRNGCAKRLWTNQRADSCSPPPSSADNPWDCVQIEQGNKSSIVKGLKDRFQCTPNRWTTPVNLPPDGDPRWAYIILTGFGRTVPAANGDWLPIEGLIRVYVTGWDEGSGNDAYEDCGGLNDDPPRGYDGKGAQLWGHMVEIITLDDAVIVGDGDCDLAVDLVTCKPVLVR